MCWFGEAEIFWLFLRNIFHKLSSENHLKETIMVFCLFCLFVCFVCFFVCLFCLFLFDVVVVVFLFSI